MRPRRRHRRNHVKFKFISCSESSPPEQPGIFPSTLLLDSGRQPALNDAVAKLSPFIHEARRLSCGRVDDVVAAARPPPSLRPRQVQAHFLLRELAFSASGSLLHISPINRIASFPLGNVVFVARVSFMKS